MPETIYPPCFSTLSGPNISTPRSQSEAARWVGVLPGQGHFFPVRRALLGQRVRPTLVGNIGPGLVPQTVPARTQHPEGRLVWALLTSAGVRGRGRGFDGPTASRFVDCFLSVRSQLSQVPAAGHADPRFEHACWSPVRGVKSSARWHAEDSAAPGGVATSTTWCERPLAPPPQVDRLARHVHANSARVGQDVHASAAGWG